MLINCPHCSARVDAKEHDVLDRLNREEDGYASSGIRVRFLQCPSCGNPLVSKEDLKSHTIGHFNMDETEWSPPQRVWPEPETTFGATIPRGVRVSLDEARGYNTLIRPDIPPVIYQRSFAGGELDIRGC
jgi:hypothetical protein